jgi:ribonuclease BN (tRNA processing enzyme)
MELIMLGSGTGIPLNDRASPSFVLFINRHPILFDLGPGTLRQLTRIGLSHEGIARIFFTHFHPDHTADLIHLLFATRNPLILRKRRPFVLTGACGLRNFVEGLQAAHGHWLNLPEKLMKIEELEEGGMDEKDYGDFKIITRPALHTPHSIAYRVENREGQSVVYTGDTGFSDDIVDLSKGVDLLITESSFPDGSEEKGHLTPSLAGRMASLAKAKTLLLTHFYPEVLATDIAAACRKTYQGELILGRDLLHLTV